ncbi:MAG: ribonuclease III [Bacillota bacterium]|nr:ribonuclease III [Bacillota bacterium]
MASFLDKKLINELERKIKINFKDKLLLQRALTHKSFSNENTDLALRDNERLEFLGDSVLSIIISSYIFDNFPDYPEGELAKMRSVIVSEPSLAAVARNINLGKYILLGKGEDLSGGRNRNSILADTIEALIGAIYLDKGIIIAGNFIIKHFKDKIEKVEKGEYIQDYKTILQEYIQKDSIAGPVYHVVREDGPDHHKLFTVQVRHREQLLGIGKGYSKKEAEQNAAKEALEGFKKISKDFKKSRIKKLRRV